VTVDGGREVWKREEGMDNLWGGRYGRRSKVQESERNRG